VGTERRQHKRREKEEVGTNGGRHDNEEKVGTSNRRQESEKRE
jgi:hypothetical protein